MPSSIHRPSRFFNLFCIMLAGSALCASASDFNYQTFVLGERSGGMGMTGVANPYSIDAAYVNPAGLAKAHADSISFMATLYGFRQYQEKSSFQSGEDFKTRAFEIIPATAGSVMQLATNTSASFSMFITDQRTISEMQSHDKERFFNMSINDQTLWIGPAIGHRITPKTLVGAAAYLVYRSSSTFNNFFWLDEETALAYNRKFHHYGLVGQLGLIHHASDSWRFGCTIQAPSVSLQGKASVQAHQLSVSDDATYGVMFHRDGLDVNNSTPAKFAVGVAYERSRKFSCELNLAYHLPSAINLVEGDDETGIPAARSSRKSVLDLNLGAEYYIRPHYPLRAGFFTSFSAAPTPTADPFDDKAPAASPPKIDLYGLTASIGRETERLYLNVGLNYVFGNGKTLGWETDDDGLLGEVVVDARESNIYVFFSTSYLL